MIGDLQVTFNMECVCMLMVYLPTKFNRSGSNDPLLAPMKPEDKPNFRTFATVYYILQHHPTTSSYISKMYYITQPQSYQRLCGSNLLRSRAGHLLFHVDN